MLEATPSLSPNPELDHALRLVKAAGYRVTKPKRKLTSRGPTCVVSFADGNTCRMTTHCHDDALDYARGVKLCQAAWSTRTGLAMMQAPQVISAHFERDGQHSWTTGGSMRKFDPQRFRSAVMVVSRMRAKKAVVAQLRAQGLKPQHYTAREISLMAEDYFAKHAGDIIAKATEDVASFPEFAQYRCAELLSAAQLPGRCSDSTISVQNSSAERRADQ